MADYLVAVLPVSNNAGKGAEAILLEENATLITGLKDFEGAFGKASHMESDLLRLAAAVFAADRACRRGEREQLCRNIELIVPVVHAMKFAARKNSLERILRTLSRDTWSIAFESHSAPATDVSDCAPTQSDATNSKTLLFSGGLDSLAGAIEYGSSTAPLHLVSHTTHNTTTSHSQKDLVTYLTSMGLHLTHNQIFVSSRDGGQTNLQHDVEPSQRTRSFVFLVVGALVARRLGSNELLLMAENGQMAIHLPLSSARTSAFSTHTADPEVLRLCEEFLTELLGVKLKIDNPFLYSTKAEVVKRTCQHFFPSLTISTSCWKNARAMKFGARHCGECVPCLIRHIAISTHCSDPTVYARQLLAEPIRQLPESDDGRRNLVDLCEFIYRFSSMTDEDLLSEFPELYSEDISASAAIEMYRRFSVEAKAILSKAPNVASLLT